MSAGTHACMYMLTHIHGEWGERGRGKKWWKEGRRTNSVINVLVVLEKTCKIKKARKKTKQ